ncbi:MAG TPA: hypothetical protein VFR39_02045 [Burkholderiales bacterium]|nr:hypothetical protein [Burkholderiales bacterium]
MTESFWKDAVASLPPSVQRRYATEIEAMERYDVLMDAAVDAWRYARRALGKSCQAAARLFDNAAQRLLLSR